MHPYLLQQKEREDVCIPLYIYVCMYIHCMYVCMYVYIVCTTVGTYYIEVVEVLTTDCP